MSYYELQVGVYIDAESVEEAWEKFSPVVELANNVDAEKNAFAELVGIHKPHTIPLEVAEAIISGE